MMELTEWDEELVAGQVKKEALQFPKYYRLRISVQCNPVVLTFYVVNA